MMMMMLLVGSSLTGLQEIFQVFGALGPTTTTKWQTTVVQSIEQLSVP